MARSRLQVTPLHRGLTLPGKRNLPGQVACCLKPELNLGARPISRFPCVFKSSNAQRYVAAKAELSQRFTAESARFLAVGSRDGLGGFWIEEFQKLN